MRHTQAAAGARRADLPLQPLWSGDGPGYQRRRQPRSLGRRALHASRPSPGPPSGRPGHQRLWRGSARRRLDAAEAGPDERGTDTLAHARAEDTREGCCRTILRRPPDRLYPSRNPDPTVSTRLAPPPALTSLTWPPRTEA